MQEKCFFDRITEPTLSTGEKFYTNMSKSGYTPHGGDQITLDQYLVELRTQFSSVVVKEMATDSIGRKLEDDVAIFVKR